MTTQIKKKIKTALILLGLLFLTYYIYNGIKSNTDFHQADTLNWISTSKGAIHIRTYKNVQSPDSINLVFVIHGDAPFEKPDYHYQMAQKIAAQNKNTIAIGILRPGYTDPENNTSNGKKGFTTGDNYTPAVIEAISEVIIQLKKTYNPINIILIGHSGGSAITGDLIGMKSDLVNKAVLVSCPCNVSKWRKHMSSKQIYNPGWLFSTNSISPITVADSISEKTEVVIIVGENDETTPLYLSKEYYDKLISLNKKSKLVLIPNKGHEILLNEMVQNEIKQLLK